MYPHVMVGSNDLPRSRKFYDALFAAVGRTPTIEDENGRLIYVHKNMMFLVTKPIDGEPARCGNGNTIGFGMDDPVQANAWHKAGVNHGGTSIEDPPGIRGSVIGDLYSAYLRDTNGNKLCALYQMPVSE